MKHLLQKIKMILKNRRFRRIWYRTVGLVSAVVVFIATYALVMPAITLDVSTASMEPGIVFEQTQYRTPASNVTAAAAENTSEETAVETAAEELQIEEVQAEEPEQEEPQAPAEESAPEETEASEEETSAEAAPVEEEPQTETPSGDTQESALEETETPEEEISDEAVIIEEEPQTEAAPAEQPGTTEEAAATATTEQAAEFQIPELRELDFDEALTGRTGFYYYHNENADAEENVSSDSVDDWKKADSDTVLAPADFVRVYLPYEIPAGALNETNQTAHFRLPGNLHITDKQVRAINKFENGIYKETGDSKYLGAEAIEGTRTPDEKLHDGEEEYISALVKVENLSDGGQNLVFTFTPYTIGKNQTAYDQDGQVTAEGQKVKGWFTVDFTVDQIDWDDVDESTETVKAAESGQGSATEEKTVTTTTKKAEIDFTEDRGAVLTLVEKKETAAEAADQTAMPAQNFEETVTVKTGKVSDEQTVEAAKELPGKDKLTVRVEAEEGTFPEGTTMKVTPIKGSKLEEVGAAAADAVDGTACGYQAVDISFINADGEEIEPAKAIRVTMTSNAIAKAAEAEKISASPAVVHVADDGNAEANNNILADPASGSKDAAADSVVFEADQFSTYVLVYTVDFEYTVNGKVYRFSIPGNATVRLSDLIEELGMRDGTKYETVSDFISQVEDVQFSDENLVKVTPISGDWQLESLQPFDTEETLTITMKDGTVITVKVTDDNSYSSDLKDFLKDVSINADIEDGKYVIKPGKTYSAYFDFKEDSEGLQFSQDGKLEYTFPDGFIPDPTEETFTIIATSKGVDYPVEGNRYSVKDGKLSVELNTEHPNYQYVTSSAVSKLGLAIEGQFDINKEEIIWSDTVKSELKPDLDTGVSIEKSIVDFNKDTGVINYQLLIKSLNGTNTNIVVSDQMSGTALRINEDVSILGADMSADGVNYTRLPYGDRHVTGFSFTIPSMEKDQTAKVTYTATIDKDKLIENGVNLDWDGKNSVTATPDGHGKPDKSSTDLKNIITAPTLTKSSSVSDVKDGKRTITWTIIATSNEYFPLAGGKIIDSIQEDSRRDMKYSGDGLAIVVTDANGFSQTRNILWSEVGVNDPNSDFSWEYSVPVSDGNNRTYEITYTTEVDVSEFVVVSTLKNTVEDDNKSTEGSAQAGPDGDNRIAKVEKTHGTPSVEYTPWNVDITVPVQGLNHAKLIDTLPNLSGYHDTLHGSIENDVEIIGLDGSLERAQISYENYQLIINFQKRVDGSWTDGLFGGNEPRTIKVSFSTDNNQDWVNGAETQAYLVNHENKVQLEANQKVLTDTDTVRVVKSTLEKKFNSKEEVTVDGENLPLYKYTITVKGVTGPFEITDSYDPRLVPASNLEYNEQGDVYGGTQYYQGIKGSTPAAIEETEAGNMIIRLDDNSLAKENGAYYTYYRIEYALRVKDKEALNSLKAEAAIEGGEVNLKNTAVSHLGEDSVDVKYEHKDLTKELLNDAELGRDTNVGEFRISVNPDGYDMDPDSDVLTLTDTFSNTLSIDYNTIRVEPSEGASWYVSGNTATFTIPDETPVVITYKARVIGNGNIHFENTAEVRGQKDTYSDTRYVTSTMGGTSANYYIKLLKHKRLNFTELLGGAKFGLYELDESGNGVPVKDNEGGNVTVTTEADGTAVIDGRKDQDGWALIPGRMYYVQELEAPEGYNLSTTKYRFSIDEQDNPNYSQNIYFNGDTLHINNTPKGGLEIKKSVYGLELDDSQKRAISFTVTYPDETTVTKRYSDFVDGKWKLMDLPTGVYKVEETCEDVDGYTRKTTYTIDSDTSSAGDPITNGEGQTANVEITDPNTEISVGFINRYTSTVEIEPETLQLKVQKKWFVGEEDKTASGEYDNQQVVVQVERYRAPLPTTTLHFVNEDGTEEIADSVYFVNESGIEEVTDSVTVPRGADVTVNTDNPLNIRAMSGRGSMWNNHALAIDATRHCNSYTFSTGEYADVYVNFQGTPGKIKVEYSGGSASVPDDQFSLDTSYTDSVTLTGRTWSKTFNNLPLTGKENNTSYIYKYLVKEVSRINGFKTTYQIDNGEFTDTISKSDAISQDGNHSIVIKNEKETTDFEFTKIWKNASGETEINWQKDISVSLNTQKGKVADFTLNELGGTNGEYTWTCTKNADHTFTFKISNLPAYDSDGELTYYVRENSVDGYNEPIYAFIQNGTIVSKPDSDETKDRASDGQYIINMPVESYELPNTGGPGTKLITLLGSMLLLGAGMILIMRRRITL